MHAFVMVKSEKVKAIYTYQTDIEDLRRGDRVLVPTPYGEMEGMFVQYTARVRRFVRYKKVIKAVERKKSLLRRIFKF